MNLYTVTFTTRAMTRQFDKRGKVIAEVRTDKPITMTALPRATAMSYSGCDNFKMTHYEPDEQRASRGSGRDNSVGNGTKRTASRDTTGSAVAAKQSKQSSLVSAANTGNLGAAVNV